MKKAVMYGAGNIGRGFIGQLFSESGYGVTFIDINAAVIDALNKRGCYTVGIVSGGGTEAVTVNNVRGVMGTSPEAVAKEMEDASVMATALGVNVLKHVAKHLAAGVMRRIDAKRPLNILLCENLLGADAYIKGLILNELPESYRPLFDTYIGLVETSIGRMVPLMEKTGDPLAVNVEPYCFLPADKEAFIGGIPDIKNLYPYAPFAFFTGRKLYMHNMSHALTAYLGNLKGYRYIWQAIGDPEIYSLAYSALVRSAKALSLAFGTGLDGLLDHASNLLFRFKNKALGDTVARVGADTKRKLAPGDRLCGAVKLLSEHSVYDGYHLAGVAAALLFAPDGDAGAKEIALCAAEKGVRAALETYTDIRDGEQIRKTEYFYNTLKTGGGLPAVLDFCIAGENGRMIL